jgi:hypothetical protein
MESLASSGITVGERPSVQRSASIASPPVKKAIARGCADFKPSEDFHASLAQGFMMDR